jgi:hypothetical protein
MAGDVRSGTSGWTRIGRMVELRKAQPCAEHLATGVKRRAGNACVERRAHEIGNLSRLFENGAKDCGDIRGAVGTQPDQGSRRKPCIDGVNDHATGDKGNSAAGRDAGGDVGFGIDRCSTSLRP